MLSLAGRTKNPQILPVPMRIGGFGGIDGLKTYLLENKIELLIDATHPYAANISNNAHSAAKLANVPVIALNRPKWEEETGDNWQYVADVTEAVAALNERQNIFVALGRNELLPFLQKPNQNYTFRSVDEIDESLKIKGANYIIDKGPFKLEKERELLKKLNIQTIICKNSGTLATYDKIIVAREMGIKVIMIERPKTPYERVFKNAAEVLEAVKHYYSQNH